MRNRGRNSQTPPSVMRYQVTTALTAEAARWRRPSLRTGPWRGPCWSAAPPRGPGNRYPPAGPVAARADAGGSRG
ncbi:hypothetical protein G6F31_021299 [Rhizopus arrhizus]|nr:hypothetical protein G6F31_021299 [Rhizopus arrhizus]